MASTGLGVSSCSLSLLLLREASDAFTAAGGARWTETFGAGELVFNPVVTKFDTVFNPLGAAVCTTGVFVTASVEVLTATVDNPVERVNRTGFSAGVTLTRGFRGC